MAFRASSRTGTPADLLIVGLGNPGDEYDKTRHNIGVDVVHCLAARHGIRLSMSSKERSLVGEGRIGQHRVVLAFPQTYMNLSGEAVSALVKRHGITDAAQVVVIHDDLDLPSARMKLKLGGGSGGQNGLKSITAHLNSPDYVRVRIGIGRPPGSQAPADYVLKRPGKTERIELDVTVELAADAVESILSNGLERAMNAVNTDPNKPERPKKERPAAPGPSQAAASSNPPATGPSTPPTPAATATPASTALASTAAPSVAEPSTTSEGQQ